MSTFALILDFFLHTVIAKLPPFIEFKDMSIIRKLALFRMYSIEVRE